MIFRTAEKDKSQRRECRPLERRGFKPESARKLRIALQISCCLCILESCDGKRLPFQTPKLSQSAKWLQEYLQIDTSNPPGQEEVAVDFLAEILASHSVSTHRLRSPEGRSSLYARLSAQSPGSAPAPAIVLMHHIDVVPAGPGWAVDAFSGSLSEGRIWGRGALDAKSLGIAQLAALVSLTQTDQPMTRDVIYLAVADEEEGGLQGARWVLEEHPELFSNVAGVLNEGGGNRKLQSRLFWWGVEVAQKHPLWLEVSTLGQDNTVDQASRKLVSALSRLLARNSEWRVTEPVRVYLGALAQLTFGERYHEMENIDEVIAKGEQSKGIMPGMQTLFLDSVQINVIETSPNGAADEAVARAEIDIRLLPDTDADTFLKDVSSLLGDEVEVRVLLSGPASPASPTNSEVYELLLRDLLKEAPVVPLFSPGFTDCRFFRKAGINCYGFFPFAIRSLDVHGIHGPDERIPLEDFDQGVALMEQIVKHWAFQPMNSNTSDALPLSPGSHNSAEAH